MKMEFFGVPLSWLFMPRSWLKLMRRAKVTGTATQIIDIRLWPTDYVWRITRVAFHRLPNETLSEFRRRAGKA